MNAAKSLLFLSFFMKIKSDIELEKLTESSLKEEQKAKNTKKDKTKENNKKRE